MFIDGFISFYKSLLLDYKLPLIFFLLFLKNTLQQVFTWPFIHLQNSLCYNLFDHFCRQIIEQIPILVVSLLFFHGSLRILRHICPLLLCTELFKDLGILLCQLLNESDLRFVEALTRLELPNLSLELALKISFLLLLSRIHQLLKLLILYPLLFNSCNLRKVLNCYLETCFWINILLRVSGELLRFQPMRLVP